MHAGQPPRMRVFSLKEGRGHLPICSLPIDSSEVTPPVLSVMGEATPVSIEP